MDFEQAERHYRKLQQQRDDGELDGETYHVEVAKLLLRDELGAFWMIDAADGLWYCNRGEGWIPGDPHGQRSLEAARLADRRARQRRTGGLLALVVALVIVAGGLAVLVWFQWAPDLWNPVQPLLTPRLAIDVTIASPADGAQVALGQEVGIETMLSGNPDLQGVDRVKLRVDGQVVDSRQVRSQIQPGQPSLPLSLPWRSAAAGEHQVTVTALSDRGDTIGEASIVLHAATALNAPPCTPDATFLADVTIPPGEAFPPGARMEKVWQVSNSGTCAWGVGYELVLVDGEGLGAPSSVPVSPSAAGESADLAVTFWAPTEAGRHRSVWQLQSPDGGFFGPRLTLEILVETLAQENRPPAAPTDLQARVTEAGDAVHLTWMDQSEDEDAFRIYRQDVDASIGLAPANAQLFVDAGVVCGNTYRYAVVAFNAAGASTLGEMAQATLPACAPADALPAVTLTLSASQVLAGQLFTVAFEAVDDLQVVEVRIWGEETGDPLLDDGHTFACEGPVCTGSWPIVWAGDGDRKLMLVAVARDSSGQESEPARIVVRILSSDRPPDSNPRPSPNRNGLPPGASIPWEAGRPNIR